MCDRDEERRGLRKIVSMGRGLRAGFDNFFCYFNCDLGLCFCCVVGGGAGGALGLGQGGLGLVDVDDVEAVRLLGEDLNGGVLVDCHGSGGDEELLDFTAVLVDSDHAGFKDGQGCNQVWTKSKSLSKFMAINT